MDDGMENGGVNISNRLRRCYVFCGAYYRPLPKTAYLGYKAQNPPDEATQEDIEQGKWRMDGAGFGVRYFASPTFLDEPPAPAQIDIWIPDQMDWPSELWARLDARDSVHLSRDAVLELGITRHLTKALTNWVNTYEGFEKDYRSLPFGSQIMFKKIEADPAHMTPDIIKNDSFSQYLLTPSDLRQMWQLEREMPPIVTYTKLTLEKQLAPCISLVKFRDDPAAEPMVFKSDDVTIPIVYHELKVLLTMQPMPNIVEPPTHLVTTHDGKVLGFLLKYYRLGDLEQLLPDLKRENKLQMHQQVQWAIELTEAFIHLRSNTDHEFYSDLRMDNLLMQEHDNGQRTIILTDFQQNRDVYSWSPPEVYYLEFLAELSVDDYIRSHHIPAGDTKRYGSLLESYLKSRDYQPWPLRAMGARYDNPKHGWYFPWLAASSEEREAGMVYLLGKALWCLFEGAGEVGKILGRSASREEEGQLRFPHFEETPKELQALIRACTSGAREWEDGPGQDGPISILRRRGKIFPLGKSGKDGEPAGTVEETQAAITSFWDKEIEKAERFVEARLRYDKGEASHEDRRWLCYLDRPTLKEVRERLKHYAST